MHEATGLEQKYHDLAKAQEYAHMSWPQFDENDVSEPFYRRVADMLRTASGLVETADPLVVSIGFGAGRELYELRSALPEATILGIEDSREMIEVARTLLGEVKIGTEFGTDKEYTPTPGGLYLSQGSADKLPVADSCANFISMVNVIDRVISPRDVIAEFIRIAAPGCIVVLVSADDYGESPTSYGDLTKDEVLSTFLYNGFSIIDREEFELNKLLADTGDTVLFDEWGVTLRKDSPE